MGQGEKSVLETLCDWYTSCHSKNPSPSLSLSIDVSSRLEAEWTLAAQPAEMICVLAAVDPATATRISLHAIEPTREKAWDRLRDKADRLVIEAVWRIVRCASGGERPEQDDLSWEIYRHRRKKMRSARARDYAFLIECLLDMCSNNLPSQRVNEMNAIVFDFGPDVYNMKLLAEELKNTPCPSVHSVLYPKP